MSENFHHFEVILVKGMGWVYALVYLFLIKYDMVAK